MQLQKVEPFFFFVVNSYVSFIMFSFVQSALLASLSATKDSAFLFQDGRLIQLNLIQYLTEAGIHFLLVAQI